MMKKINTDLLPEASIIIITLNEEKKLPRLLKELAEQTYQNFQLIVSDSNSSDNTQLVVEQFNQKWNKVLFYQCGVTNGPGRGRNRWVEQAKHEIIFFFDADTQLSDKQFLAKALSSFQKNNLDVAGAYTKPNTSRFDHLFGTRVTNIICFIFQHTSLPIAAWGCMMTKKSIHTDIAWFDESITLGEDSAYVQRAKKHWFTFWILPQRFIFDMRRIEHYGVRNTAYTYLKTLFRLIGGWDFPRKKDTKQVDYPFDEYSK
jgi:glycosyltransferase involved in cell wall biosynthesis